MILLCALLLAQDNPSALIEQLRSDSIDQRNDATRKIKEAGLDVLPLLKKASTDADLELAQRAAVLVRVIPIYVKLTPALRKAMPGVEERLALEDPVIWTRTFLDALSSTDRVRNHPSLGAADVEALAGRALDAAPDDVARHAVCILIGNLRIRSAWAPVVKLMESQDHNLRACAGRTLKSLRIPASMPPLKAYLREGPPHAAEGAIAALGTMWARESIPEIETQLGSSNSRQRIAALHALTQMDARESFPKIARLLDDPEASVREVAIRCLGYGWYPKSLPAIVRRLQDPDLQVRREAASTLGSLNDPNVLDDLLKSLNQLDELERTNAVRAIGALGAEKSLPRIRELLKSPDQNVRLAVAGTLRDLNAPSEVPSLLELLKDEDDSVRFFTAGYLGELGVQEAVPEISRLLTEQSMYRGSAMSALAMLDRREFIPRIIEALNDPDDGVGAANALAIYRSREAAPQLLKALEQHQSWHLMLAVGKIGIPEAIPFVKREIDLPDAPWREIAGRSLCALGSRDGAPIVIGEGDFLTTLNALRSPGGWLKIRDRVVKGDRYGTRAELAEFIAKECGMRLQGPTESQELWSTQKIWMRRSAYTPRFQEALDAILGMRYDAIIDEDRILILPRHRARAFWEDWWEAGQNR